MVENPMNNAVIVRTQVTLSVDVVKFEAQDVITASTLIGDNGQTGGQTDDEIAPPKGEL